MLNQLIRHKCLSVSPLPGMGCCQQRGVGVQSPCLRGSAPASWLGDLQAFRFILWVIPLVEAVPEVGQGLGTD